MKKKVSIIIPAYNCDKVIERCVNSFIEQTYDNIEIIVVNDGSKDNTKDILECLAKKDERIKVINKKNDGVSIARNTGIENASGEYVQFADADDYVTKNCVYELVKCIEEDDSDLVIAGYEKIQDGKSNVITPYKHQIYNIHELKYDFFELYNSYLINMPWNKLFKKELICTLFDANMSLGEDLIFNIDYIKRVNKISTIDFAGYRYCFENGNSLAGSFRADKFDNSKFLHNCVIDFAVDTLGCEKSKINDLVYIMEIRYSITNLIRSELSKKEKISLIDKWCKDEAAINQYRCTAGLGSIDKIIRFLFLHKMSKTMYYLLKLAL